MDGHVNELSAGAGCILQCALDNGNRVLGIAANQNDVADITAVDLFLCNSIGMVEAAHEAQHEGQLRMSFYNLFCSLALLYGLSQRLFTEYMLACIHSQLNHIHMGSGVGDDGNCLNIRVVAQVSRILIYCGYAQLFCYFLCTGDILVTDCNQITSRYTVCDVACMLITQTANADDTNFQLFHNDYLLMYDFFRQINVR